MNNSDKLLVIDEMSERGVENPRVIDLISHHEHENIIELKIVEMRPWADSREQLEQLQEKINNYLDYLLDGFFLQQYPQYAGIPITILLECDNTPTPNVSKFLTAAKSFVKSTGIEFDWKINQAL